MKTTRSIQKPEIWVFILALLCVNLTLLSGEICDALVFSTPRFETGEWWRILTFPLVHVSWYHLLMDAGAFLFLYHGLQTASLWKRLAYIGGCAIGSLLVSLSAESLCGLSGIAHGLMVVTGLEMMERSDSFSKKAGAICCGLVILKSIYEALSGQIAFDFLHFGYVGNAVAICHAGGVLGGICSYAIIRQVNLREKSDAAHTNG